jgi:hypothetical protein
MQPVHSSPTREPGGDARQPPGLIQVLPRRIPKAPKRASRWRSIAHCNFVRSHFCCVPGCPGMPIEVAHVRRGSGAGVGQKPDDWNTLSLCRDHHAQQHRIGEQSFEQAHKIDMRRMADEFSARSPKAADIRAVRRERELV